MPSLPGGPRSPLSPLNPGIPGSPGGPCGQSLQASFRNKSSIVSQVGKRHRPIYFNTKKKTKQIENHHIHNPIPTVVSEEGKNPNKA